LVWHRAKHCIFMPYLMKKIVKGYHEWHLITI
jgi:hypothetical protein